jgi:hypothetical protein
MRSIVPFTADPALLKTCPAEVCTLAKPGALRYLTTAHVPNVMGGSTPQIKKQREKK